MFSLKIINPRTDIIFLSIGKVLPGTDSSQAYSNRAASGSPFLGKGEKENE